MFICPSVPTTFCFFCYPVYVMEFTSYYLQRNKYGNENKTKIFRNIKLYSLSSTRCIYVINYTRYQRQCQLLHTGYTKHIYIYILYYILRLYFYNFITYNILICACYGVIKYLRIYIIYYIILYTVCTHTHTRIYTHTFDGGYLLTCPLKAVRV